MPARTVNDALRVGPRAVRLTRRPLVPGTLRARILAGTGANLVGQGVTVAIQLLSLPLFLHFWDMARYGKWVLLSAIPAYLSMSDGGIVPVASNRITMLAAREEHARADIVFRSALALVTLAVIAIGAATAAGLALLPESALERDSRLALWLLIVCTLTSLYGGLFDAGFRAYGSYAQGALAASAVRMLEFAGLALGLAATQSLVGAAMGTLAGRGAGSICMLAYCHRNFAQLRWSLSGASRSELRALLRPAASYLAFPLGNGLAIQAVTLLVGALFGTVTVAIFNTYRTLSRIVVQVIATFSHALWPDFSRMYGMHRRRGLQCLFERSLVAGIGLSFALAALTFLAAPALLDWWSQGKIRFDRALFELFALATLFGGIWHVPRILLLATNRHTHLGAIYLAACAFGVGVSWAGARLVGTPGVIVGTIATEVAMLAMAIGLARREIRSMPGEGDHAA